MGYGMIEIKGRWLGFFIKTIIGTGLKMIYIKLDY
jgi:hypothetical protein